MQLQFNKCDMYILLWIIYSSQGVFYAKGSALSQGILFLILIWSLYYFLKLFKTSKEKYTSNLRILLSYQIILGVILILSGKTIKYSFLGNDIVPNWYYLKNIGINWLHFFAFLAFCHQGLINEKKIKLYAIIFFLISLMSFYSNFQTAVLVRDIEDFGDTTNNAGYRFLSLIPFAFVLGGKKTYQYVYLLLVYLMILICMKRGAIIVGTLAMAMYLFYSVKKSKSNRLGMILLTVAFVIGVAMLVLNMYEGSEYMQRRLLDTQEGNSSGRDIIYTMAISYLQGNTDWIHAIFGGGAFYTIEVLGIEAHNDWLEMAINGGLVGIIIYIWYWVGFYKQWKSSPADSTYRNVIALCLTITFLETFFSMSNVTVGMSALLAYSIYKSQPSTDIYKV